MRFTDSRFCTLAFSLALLACDEGSAPAPEGSGGGAENDAGVTECSRPASGCPCEQGAEPIECYPEPVTLPGGGQACLGAGLRFCRDGAWTACDVGPRSTSGAAVVTAPLLEGPTLCNSCDPRCFDYNDRPTSQGDLDGHSSGVVIRPGGAGVELPQSGVYMGSGDADGDGVPDDFDGFPNDPSRDGFTEEGGLFHMLPEGGTEGPDPITISTAINSADVYVLMDATASMAGEIANLRASLTTGNYLDATHPTVAVSGNEAMGSAHSLGTDPSPGTYTLTGNTSSMNNDHDVAGCGGSSNSRDAVFTFTLTSTHTVTLSTAGSGYDTTVSLRNASFGEIACNDDSNNTRQSYLSQSLAAGTYYVLLEGYGGTSGAYTMSIRFENPACAGVLGAINCIIPNAQFGLGWFREYPVAPHGLSTNPVYRHELDITSNLTAVQTAVNALRTQGNADWPESLTQGLFAAVTGNGLGSHYPARSANSSFSACPAGRWGYPCFRDGTIPIVIAFTDAPMHEGPDPQFDYTFDERWPATTETSLEQNGQAEQRYRNDTQDTAYDMGDITTFIASNNRRIYAGRTSWTSGNSSYSLGDNYGGYSLGCNAGSADAVFKFTLSARRRVQLAPLTTNATYVTVLSLFRDSISQPNRLTCNVSWSGTRGAINETLDAGTYYVVVDGFGAGQAGPYYLSVNGRTQTDGSPPYPSAQAPAYWTHTAHALAARNVKFIGIRSCADSEDGDAGDMCPDTLQDLESVGRATGSVDDSGAPFAYTISTDGSGLSSTVVTAVQRLANFSRMDVSARARDNPATTGFDERNFVQSIVINNCSASRCTGPRTGSMCGQCLPGTDVGFNVTFHNSGVAPTGVPRAATAQVFDFTLELVGDGTYVLDSVPVRIVVPPIRAEYAASGSYWRDFDSTERCTADERPDWGTLDWAATTPGNTSITLELRAADSAAGLPSAAAASVVIPPATPTRDIAALLRSAGYPDGRRHLRVTAVLSSGPARDATPTLDRLAVNYTCLPAE